MSSTPPTKSHRSRPATAPTPPGPRQPVRVNHDYRRGGAVAYLAAYDVHHAKVFGRCEASTGIGPFIRLVAQVMSVEPYASATRVFWIVDNGSSHRGQAAIDRLAQRYPERGDGSHPGARVLAEPGRDLLFHRSPESAAPNDFPDIEAVKDRLARFAERHSATATPFNWRYTTADLRRPPGTPRLLRRHRPTNRVAGGTTPDELPTRTTKARLANHPCRIGRGAVRSTRTTSFLPLRGSCTACEYRRNPAPAWNGACRARRRRSSPGRPRVPRVRRSCAMWSSRCC